MSESGLAECFNLVPCDNSANLESRLMSKHSDEPDSRI